MDGFSAAGNALPKARAVSDLQITGQTLRELCQRDWKTPEYVIGPWLREGEAAMIWAATGVGKTMLSLTIALMAAGGGSVAGWTSPKPRRVLVVDGEMRGADLVERLKRLASSIEGINLEAALDNIEIRARQMQHPEVPFYDLSQPQTHEALSGYIRKRGFELVILDNITTLTDSLTEENEVGAVRPILSFVMKLKQAEVASIVVHHANKSGGNYRGSTGLVAPLEAVIGLTRPPTEDYGKAAFCLEFNKFRHRGEGLGPRIFRLEETGEASRWLVTEDEESLLARLVAEIRKCKHPTQGEAGKALGISDKSKVSRMLSAATAKRMTTKAEIKYCLDAATSSGDEDFL